MDVLIYAAAGPAGGERTLAYHLLALALEREYGLDSLPEIAREPGGKPFFPAARIFASASATVTGPPSALCMTSRWASILRSCVTPPSGWRRGWRTARFSVSGRQRRPPSSGGGKDLRRCLGRWSWTRAANAWRTCWKDISSLSAHLRRRQSGRCVSNKRERRRFLSRLLCCAVYTACFMDREMRFFFSSTSSTTTFTMSPTDTASEGCLRNLFLLIWEICTSPS